MRPSFPKRQGQGGAYGTQPPPPPPKDPPVLPSQSMPTTTKNPPASPSQCMLTTSKFGAGVPVRPSTAPGLPVRPNTDDLRHRKDEVDKQVKHLEELQRSFIEAARRQMNPQPGDVFLQPLEAVTRHLGEIASGLCDAKTKKAHLENYEASLSLVNHCPPPSSTLPMASPYKRPLHVPTPSNSLPRPSPSSSSQGIVAPVELIVEASLCVHPAFHAYMYCEFAKTCVHLAFHARVVI